MSLKSLFKTACKYAAYYNDVLSVIPSQGVKDALKEKGWRFTPSPEAAALLEVSAVPHTLGQGIPLETVTTENGTDVYRAGGVDIIDWYKDDKKEAARKVHGIKAPCPY